MKLFQFIVLAGLSGCLMACGDKQEDQTETETTSVNATPSPSPTPEREYPETPMPLSSGGTITIIEEGDGDKPKAGERVFFEYRIQMESGTVIEQSGNNSEPTSLTVGGNNILPEWEEAMQYLRIHSKAKIIFSDDSKIYELLNQHSNTGTIEMTMTRVPAPFENQSENSNQNP